MAKESYRNPFKFALYKTKQIDFQINSLIPELFYKQASRIHATLIPISRTDAQLVQWAYGRIKT